MYTITCSRFPREDGTFDGYHDHEGRSLGGREELDTAYTQGGYMAVGHTLREEGRLVN